MADVVAAADIASRAAAEDMVGWESVVVVVAPYNYVEQTTI